MRWQSVLFYLTFCGIFLLSFFLYSPYYNIRFSSDNAVHVLMAHDLQLPDDLYYWGQDRLGSLVPILAFGFHKGLGIGPLAAVSIVHYGLLLCTALIVCRYFRSYLSRILFVGLWLLPLPEFNQHLQLGHPYAPQLFLLFTGLYLHEQKVDRLAVKALLFFAGNLLLFLSCWISELSICFIAAYYLLLGLRLFVNRKEAVPNRLLLLINTGTTLLAALLTGLFVSYAKAHAVKMSDYAQFFSPMNIWWKGIAQHWNAFIETMRNVVDFPFQSFYAIIFCFILCGLAILLLRQKLKPLLSFYPLLFFFTGFGTWCFLYTLHWTAFNVFLYKYWCFPFPFVLISLLLVGERSTIARKVPVILFCILFTCQMPVTWRYATDKLFKTWEVGFYKSERDQYKKLGNCGIIGSYWFTYSIACAAPDSILSIPHDRDYVRNSRYAPEVFKKETIYLVQNIWLNEWPTEITQFGHRLVKSGGSFRIERASFCRYRLADQ